MSEYGLSGTEAKEFIRKFLDWMKAMARKAKYLRRYKNRS